MGRKKRPFIDKKVDNCRHFVLLPRSQKDPLIIDDDAPQNVLYTIDEDDTAQSNDARVYRLARIKEEEKKYGVHFDDDYDYMQHLKSVDEFHSTTELVESTKSHRSLAIPANALPSKREEKVGLLNRAAPDSGPKIGWDPDIVETLDDEFDCPEVICVNSMTSAPDGCHVERGDEIDDILTRAMEESVHGDNKDDSDDDDDNDDYESDDAAYPSSEDGTVSSVAKFTEYSVSSSVVPRSEALQHLDDRFEAFFDNYHQMSLGGLELDDIDRDDRPSSDQTRLAAEAMADFHSNWTDRPQVIAFNDITSDVVDKGKLLAQADLVDSQPDCYPCDEEDVVADRDEMETKWDCESVLSTYSNTTNLPAILSSRSRNQRGRQSDRIRISGKSGLPRDVLGRTGLTVRDLKCLDGQNRAAQPADFAKELCSSQPLSLAAEVHRLSLRSRHETSDEKRERKKAVAESRRQRRIERKINVNQFKVEQMRQCRSDVSSRQAFQVKGCHRLV